MKSGKKNQDRKQMEKGTPKTGDASNIKLLLGIAVLSLLIILFVVIRKRKHDDK